MLDMSVRARMLEFLMELKAKYHLTYLFITHDLATAKFMCDRIGIMYLGRIVEMGRASTIYADPKHPYTKALLEAIPIPDPERKTKKILPRGEVPKVSIEGTVVVVEFRPPDLLVPKEAEGRLVECLLY